MDPLTLDRKLLLGYQGWFACPGDGSPLNRWHHWFQAQTPDAPGLHIELWPDTREYDADELYPTAMTLPDGSPARLYSAWNPKTVLRHFRWMKDHDLDGVYLQRFSVELLDPALRAFRDRVLANTRAGAEAHERVWALEYDISGHPASRVVEDLKRDWVHVVDDLGATSSRRYLRHRGRPVLALWGLGFDRRDPSLHLTPDQGLDLVRFFRDHPDPRYRVTLVGGVPSAWRVLRDDSLGDPAWAGVYRAFDVVNPWTVGRYGDEHGATAWARGVIAPDLAAARRAGVLYMPVVFPGFSWSNATGGAGPFNAIRRHGGGLWWRQVHDDLRAGCTTFFGAMFDEVDEGTAIFKVATEPAQIPVGGRFLTPADDGWRLPGDWYLRLAGEAGRMIRGERPLTDRVPITP
ncbi:MAG: hypothetical protein HY722_13285 [Planctomycetes bacterium]|nr:hypothetical protein [Planctomycetota bacterium]